jgi:mannosyltransferase
MELLTTLLRRNRAILAGIVIAAAVLRLYALGRESLWLDESFTVLYASESFQSIWLHWSTDVHPPLFYWLEHVALYLFGNSEWAVRILPAVTGIATVPIMYLIGKEFRDEGTGLVCAGLLAVSNFHLYYSQEGRMYSLLLFFVSVAFYAWLRWKAEGGTACIFIMRHTYDEGCRLTGISYWLLFLLSSAAAIWVHWYGVIPFLVLLAFSRFEEAISSLITIGCLCAALLPGLITIASGQVAKTWGLIGLQAPWRTAWAISGFNWLGLFVVSSLFVFGCLVLLKDDRRKAHVCIAAYGISLLAAFTLSYLVHTEFRYFIYVLPFVYLPIGVLVSSIRRKEIMAGFILMLLVSQVIIPLSEYYTTAQKDDWREAVAWVDGARPVYVVPDFNIIPYAYYSQDVTGITGIRVLNETVKDGYVVIGPAGMYDNSVLRFMDTHQPVKNFTGITVYRIHDA